MVSLKNEAGKQVVYSKRRTLALQITPTGELLIKAPHFTPSWVISDFVARKERWWRQKITLQHSRQLTIDKLNLTQSQIQAARQNALEVLQAEVIRIGKSTALLPSKVALTSAKTRWGSCNNRGTIRLNWRLLLVPKACREYVIIHELAHLRHLNHSSSFWDLVARYCPEYQTHRRRLQDYTSLLTLV